MFLLAAFIVSAADLQHTEAIPSGYVGCFKDIPQRMLSHKLNNTYTNTGDECKARCKNEGYRYAGTEVCVQCFCGNCLHGHVINSKCDYKCLGNLREYCGGHWKMSLYETWPSTLSTTQKNTVTKVFGMTTAVSKVVESSLPSTVSKLIICTPTTAAATSSSKGKLSSNTTDKPTGVTESSQRSSAQHETADLTSAATKASSSILDTLDITTNPLGQNLITSASRNNVATNSSHQLVSVLRLNIVTSPSRQPASVSRNNMTTNSLHQRGSFHNMITRLSSQINPVSGNNLTTPQSLPFELVTDWKTVNNTQFHVIQRRMKCLVAREHCSKLSASLITYTNPLKYLSLSRTVTLKTMSYWTGACSDTHGNKCVSLTKKDGGDAQLQLVHCDEEHPFICSRVANISMVTEDPTFVEMLKNMTVNSKETRKADRKLTSASDRRVSSEVVGGGIGILVLCMFAIFVLMMDAGTYRTLCCHT